MAYPSNVLHLATETSNKNHNAAFPGALPEWFIRLFSKEVDWVLDPFMGSRTTCDVAHKLTRNYAGIDIQKEYIKMARKNIPEHELRIAEGKRKYGKNKLKANQ